MFATLGVLDGDGIGPEIVPAARRTLAAACRGEGLDVAFERLPVGWEAHDEHGSVLPAETVHRLSDLDGWLMGPVLSGEYPEEAGVDWDDPTGEAYGSPSATLRVRFDLYANVRPVRSYAGASPREIDLTIFRQNTEGFYADRNMPVPAGEFEPAPGVVLSVRVTTRTECRRIARRAFEHADREGIGSVTAVHKANVFSRADGAFLEECRAVADGHPGIDLEEHLVDAFATELVRAPEEYDVVVTSNLFGDILSDEAAGVAGSLGLAPSLNAGDGHAMAQAAHGAAPDIAGEGIANPTGMILSAAMLLSWLGRRRGTEEAIAAASAVEDAVERTIEGGTRTPDLDGEASTDEFADAVIDGL